jgi:hypothetical protein
MMISCGDERAERDVCVGGFADVAGVETEDDDLCVDEDGVRVAVAGVGDFVAGDCAVVFFAMMVLSNSILVPICSVVDTSQCSHALKGTGCRTANLPLRAQIASVAGACFEADEPLS